MAYQSDVNRWAGYDNQPYADFLQPQFECAGGNGIDCKIEDAGIILRPPLK
jgi:hypothetical protein